MGTVYTEIILKNAADVSCVQRGDKTEKCEYARSLPTPAHFIPPRGPLESAVRAGGKGEVRRQGDTCVPLAQTPKNQKATPFGSASLPFFAF
jgi:hypothetical protein